MSILITVEKQKKKYNLRSKNKILNFFYHNAKELYKRNKFTETNKNRFSGLFAFCIHNSSISEAQFNPNPNSRRYGVLS